MKKPILISAVLATLLFSCKKDREAPAILVEDPQEHSEYRPGENIPVKAVFTDDVELADYKVFIANEAGAVQDEFDWDEAGDLSGDSYTYAATIQVPQGVGSMYYLHFELTDEDGKTTRDKVMLHFISEVMVGM